MDLNYLHDAFAETVCFYVYNVYSTIRCILKNPQHDLIGNSETGKKRRHLRLEEAYGIFSLEASLSGNFEDKSLGWIGVNGLN